MEKKKDQIKPWGLISLKRVLDPDMEYNVEIVFSGKDKPGWAGNFGARFGNCFAFLVEI